MESSELVEGVFEVIKETLEKDETLKLSGFANITVKSKS